MLTHEPELLKDFKLEVWREVILFHGKGRSSPAGCIQDPNIAGLYATARIYLGNVPGYTIRPVYVHTDGSQLFPINAAIKDQKCLTRREACDVIIIYREKFGPSLTSQEKEYFSPSQTAE